MKWNRWIAVIIPFGIFLLNLVMKLWFVGAHEVALDEPFTIFHAQMSLGDMLGELTKYNNPPGFEFLLHFWIRIFGDGAVAVRIPSVIFASVSAAVVYQIGKENLSRLGGLTAALLFSFASYHTYFSHEARAYAAFTCFSILSIYWFLGLASESKKVHLVLFTLTNIVLIYLHYFGFLVLFAEVVSWIFLGRKKINWKRFFVSLGVTAIAYLPQVATVIDRSGHASQEHWVDGAKLSSLYSIMVKYLNQPVIMIGLMALMIAGGIAILIRKRSGNKDTNLVIGLILIWGFGNYFLLFIVGNFVPVFLDRYIAFLSPAVYLLVGFCVSKLIIKPHYKLIFPALAVAGMLATTELAPDHGRSLKEVTEYIGKYKQAGTCVVITPRWNYRTIAYHMHRDLFRDYVNTKERMIGLHYFPADNLGRLKKFPYDSCEDLIYFQVGSDFTDPNDEILSELKTRYRMIERVEEYKPYLLTRFRKQ